jgi:hypothetical protein
LWTICLGWLWTTILLISASWVVRIIEVSNRCPALDKLLKAARASCLSEPQFLWVWSLFLKWLPVICRAQALAPDHLGLNIGAITY